MATREQLQRIVDNPLSAPGQIVMAKAQLSVLDHAEAKTKAEPEITAAGTVKLKGFQGMIYFAAGGYRCKESAKNAMHGFKQDIPSRIISKDYAAALQTEFAAYGGVQSGEAQSHADMHYTFGREFASTSEQQAEWLACFPNERRDLFAKPDPPTAEQVAFKKKEDAQLAARRRLKEIADSGRYDKNCLTDWETSDCKLPDGPEGTEIVQLLAVILEDITAMQRRGESPEFKWRDMTKSLPKEEVVAVAQEQQ
jgi:hypothetical protein